MTAPASWRPEAAHLIRVKRVVELGWLRVLRCKLS
jgi:hypothetical protein